MRQRQKAFTLAGIGALMVSLATLLGAVATLYEKVHASEKDQAFAWDNAGDTVAEIEKLKERLARVEATCQMGGKPSSPVLFEGNTVNVPGGTGVHVGDRFDRR